MIYLFIWEKYFRNLNIKAWKDAFMQKYSELNIIHIKNPLSYEKTFFIQNLESSWLFADKTFVIIDDFELFFKKDIEESSEKEDFSNFFWNIFDKLSTDITLILNCNYFDKRSVIYKKISKIWEIKDFEIKDKLDLKNKLVSIYKDKIDTNIIDYLISLKWENFSTIKNEIDKNLLTKDKLIKNDFIDISKDIEENIFEIINCILSDNISKTIELIRKNFLVLENEYFFINWLLSNLRTYFYIFLLKQKKESNNQIKENLELWNKSFILNQKFNISQQKFLKIYHKLSIIDQNIKTWKTIWSNRKDLLYEIEKSFF